VLNKVYRLRKKEVEEIFKKGRTYKGEILILKIKKNNLALSRWSFIVPLKVSKKTIERNRLRRRLTEIFGKKIKTIKPGFDGIILVYPTALDKNYREINEEIDRLLTSSNLKL
jgi:ribonuclease P protein component